MMSPKHPFTKPAAALLTLLLLLIIPTQITPTRAAPSLRAQVDQRGDVVIIGNTLGFDCAPGTPAPVVGIVGECGSNTADSAPDVFWRADSPADGQAEAGTSIGAAQARSSAVLALPAGAQVTHAYLYWAAQLAAPGSDDAVTLDRPGGFSAPVTALESRTASGNRFRSVADVTALVQANGSGAYRLSDLDMADLANLNNANAFGAWWMVVLYRLDTDPLRHLTVYDGFDGVTIGVPQTVTVSNFLVPSGPIDAKLGVVALDGDNVTAGDALAFNGITLADAQNPANNFFNGTHSYLGSAVSTAGDLPQLAGTPQSMSGVDLDVVDVAPYLAAGQTSASIAASSSADVYFLATVVSSIPTVKPDLSASTEAAADLNGGAVLPGDQIEYTIAISNTGNDTATLAELADALPVGVTYVPGSIEIVSGANAGPHTDAPGDDQAEYRAGDRSIVVRLGAGADAAQGGALGAGEATAVRFRVTVDSICPASADIASQASISATGLLNGVREQYLADGNGSAPGSPPTTIGVGFGCVTVNMSGAGSGSVRSEPAGIQCGPNCTALFPNNTVVTLSAIPAVGSAFAGWGGAVSASGNTTAIVIGGTQAVTASFALAPPSTPTATPVVIPIISPTPTSSPSQTVRVYLPLISNRSSPEGTGGANTDH